jgi:hypothetical protein
MARVLLISAASVKQFSGVSSSLDDDLIRPVIDVAQTQHILPLLGGGLYDKLVTDVSVWAGAYATLMNNYITPCLIQYTILEGVQDWHYRILGGAVGTRQSDNSSSASDSEINRLQDSSRRRAQRYCLLAIDYICKNAASFPEYGAEGATSGLLIPLSSADYLTGGLEIGVRNRHKELKRWQYDRKR